MTENQIKELFEGEENTPEAEKLIAEIKKDIKNLNDKDFKDKWYVDKTDVKDQFEMVDFGGPGSGRYSRGSVGQTTKKASDFKIGQTVMVEMYPGFGPKGGSKGPGKIIGKSKLGDYKLIAFLEDGEFSGKKGMAHYSDLSHPKKIEQEMAKEKPMLNFEDLFKDCKNMEAVEFKEKYGIEKNAAKGILDQMWLAKLSEMSADYGIYAEYFSKGFSKTIKEVEIFEPGYHNGKTFTDDDIEKIVKDTKNAMEKENVQIPIKLGHSDEQSVAKKLFGDDTKGMPALGWVKNIKKLGKKVVADLCDIPDKLYEMLEEKMWNTRSIELWEGFKSGAGANLGSVITGLALLGAEQPAVTTLATLFEEGSENVKKYNVKGDNVMTETKTTEAVVAVTTETVTPQLSEVEKFDKLREYKKAADEGKEAISQLAKFKKETAIAEDKAFLEGLAAKGQLLPFQKEMLFSVLPEIENKEVKYFDKEIEEDVTGKTKDMFKKFLSSLPNQVEYAEFSKQVEKKTAEDIDLLVKSYMQKNPTVKLEEAYKIVARENSIEL